MSGFRITPIDMVYGGKWACNQCDDGETEAAFLLDLGAGREAELCVDCCRVLTQALAKVFPGALKPK